MAGPKWCMNYDSGDYEWIDENGYSWDQGEYVYNYDRSALTMTMTMTGS